MPQAAIRADLHEALDIHADLAAEVALGLELAVDHLSEAVDLFSVRSRTRVFGDTFAAPMTLVAEVGPMPWM